jgi:hypothetical protein
MPFGNSIAEDIYKLSTKPVCEEFNLEVSRADEMFTTNPVLDDILSAIKDASIIVADISGKNPNVFYELGISHLLKQTQTIMITQDDFGQVPFDVAHFRILKYFNTVAGKASYEKQLRLTLRNILADYRSIYKNEFDFILSVLRKTEDEHRLFCLLALAQSPKPMHTDDELSVDGHNENFITDTTGFHGPCMGALGIFAMFDLVRFDSGLILITEKGRVFVELVKEKGYVLDKFELYD